jgi:hypothetical protein
VEVVSELLRAISAEYDWPDFKPRQRATASLDASNLPGFQAALRTLRFAAGNQSLTLGRDKLTLTRLKP